MSGKSIRQQPNVTHADTVGLGRNVESAVSTAGQKRRVHQRSTVGLTARPADYRRTVQNDGPQCAGQQASRFSDLLADLPAAQVFGQLWQTAQLASPLGHRLLLQQRAAEPVQRRQLFTWLVGHVRPAVARILDPPRMDNDEFGAVPTDCAAHEQIQHRLLLGQIDAHQHDDIGVLDIADVRQPAWIGQHSCAAFVIHVVAAHKAAHQLLQQVGRFVAQLGRSDRADRAGSMDIGNG